MEYKYELLVISENSLDIIQRFSLVFSRNRQKVQRFIFQDRNKEGYSTFQIEIFSDENKIDRILKQMKRIVETVEVVVLSKKSL